jgi:hypothetical protein
MIHTNCPHCGLRYLHPPKVCIECGHDIPPQTGVPCEEIVPAPARGSGTDSALEAEADAAASEWQVWKSNAWRAVPERERVIWRSGYLAGRRAESGKSPNTEVSYSSPESEAATKEKL